MGSETIALIAVAISILSLVVAGFSVGWNVYRDVILKARLKVSVSISDIVGDGGTDGPFVVVTGTNFGPGEISVAMVHASVAPLWKRLTRQRTNFVVMNPFDNPLSGQLPTRLKVGEKVDLLFDYNGDCFLKAEPTHIGLRDSFARIHWAPRGDVKTANATFANLILETPPQD